MLNSKNRLCTRAIDYKVNAKLLLDNEVSQFALYDAQDSIQRKTNKNDMPDPPESVAVNIWRRSHIRVAYPLSGPIFE